MIGTVGVCDHTYDIATSLWDDMAKRTYIQVLVFFKNVLCVKLILVIIIIYLDSAAFIQ